MAEWKYSATAFNLVTRRECPPSRTALFILKERALGTHWIGGWVDFRANLVAMEKRNLLPLPGFEPQFLGRQTHSPSLYLLKYPDFCARSVPCLTDFLEPYVRSL
jgi:hypothetical protein